MCIDKEDLNTLAEILGKISNQIELNSNELKFLIKNKLDYNNLKAAYAFKFQHRGGVSLV